MTSLATEAPAAERLSTAELQNTEAYWRACNVRGYKEKGSINTPFDLAIRNQTDRFSLAIDVINHVPRLRVAGAQAKENLRNRQIDCQNYAYEHGVDKPEVDQWTWR